MINKKVPIVVLISGNGSNLQALIDAQANSTYEIRAVVSNRADAYGLMRAKKAEIPAEVIPHQQFATRELFDQQLTRIIDHYSPKLIVLAGFMRRLGSNLVSHYSGRMINIHPSLLPKYPGLNTHQQVLAAGDADHGVSIHFVTDELDAGPIICQSKLLVHATDTIDTLKTRIQALEHKLYPFTVQLIVSGRVTLKEDGVWLDDTKLDARGYQLKFLLP